VAVVLTLVTNKNKYT